jgi:flagellar biosynthesis protein FlhB
MKRIKMRDHDVHFEHDLVAGKAEINIRRKNRTMVRAGRKMTIAIAPVDMTIFEPNADVVSQLVFRSPTPP